MTVVFLKRYNSTAVIDRRYRLHKIKKVAAMNGNLSVLSTVYQNANRIIRAGFH